MIHLLPHRALLLIGIGTLLSSCSVSNKISTLTQSGVQVLGTAKEQVEATVELTKQGVNKVGQEAAKVQQQVQTVQEGIGDIQKGAEKIQGVVH